MVLTKQEECDSTKHFKKENVEKAVDTKSGDNNTAGKPLFITIFALVCFDISTLESNSCRSC